MCIRDRILGPVPPRPQGFAVGSARAQPYAGAQEFLRVDRFAVDPGFVMQMRAGRAAGGTDLADHLSDLDGLADLDADLRQVAVAGRQAVAVDVYKRQSLDSQVQPPWVEEITL